MMGQIFISYSRADRQFIDQIIPLIRKVYGNDSVWFDDDILGGTEWWELILSEIKKNDLFVYFISNESLESPYCQAELREAIRLNKVILPVVVRRLNPAYPGKIQTDLGDTLRKIQYVDMSNGFSDPSMLTALFAAITRSLNKLSSTTDTARSTNSSNLRSGGLKASEAENTKNPLPQDIDRVLNSQFQFSRWILIRAGNAKIWHGEWQQKKGLLRPQWKYNEYRVENVAMGDFYITSHPIKNHEFQQFLDAPDGYKDIRSFDSRNHFAHFGSKDRATPSDSDVRVNVNWVEASAFCAWLSMRVNHGSWEVLEKRRRDSGSRLVIDLPTEAQWQRAAWEQGSQIALGYGWEWTRDRATNTDGYGLDSGGILHGHPFAMLRGGGSQFGITSESHVHNRYPAQMTQQSDNICFRIVCYVREKLTSL